MTQLDDKVHRRVNEQTILIDSDVNSQYAAATKMLEPFLIDERPISGELRAAFMQK